MNARLAKSSEKTRALAQFVAPASAGVPEVVHLTANRTYLELVGYSRDEIAALRAGANILADEVALMWPTDERGVRPLRAVQ